jgi:hypothetical protein
VRIAVLLHAQQRRGIRTLARRIASTTKRLHLQLVVEQERAMNARTAFGLAAFASVLLALDLPQASGQPCRCADSDTSCKEACIANEEAVQVAPDENLSSPEVAAQIDRYAAIWDKSQGPPWEAHHGMTSSQYQEQFNRLVGQGYRLIEISGYSVGGQARYAAIWEQRSGPAWVARHGLTSSQYQQEFNRLVGQGYRLIDVSGYNVGGQERYAAIWEQRSGPPWEAHHGMTASQYQQEFNRLVGQGYRLIDVSGYYVNGEDHYAAIWEQRSGPAWVARHGLSSSQYQQEFNRLVGQGYRLRRISGWNSGGPVNYAAIWEKSSGPAWVARHGLSSDAYQQEFDRLVGQGYRLRRVSGYYSNQ